MSWLLCDFGNVLALPPTPEDFGTAIQLAQCDASVLKATYWATQIPYDPAVNLKDFWAGLSKNPDAVEQLVNLDLAAWMRPKLDVVEAVERARSRGFRLALFSNAPAEFRDAFASCKWLPNFERIFVSCDVGAKPDPAAFLTVACELGAKPSGITLIDDRPENVEGAESAGMAAVLFVEAQQIDALHPAQQINLR
jgi:putative hydrolase of the HAD superfamily